jgi:hypothetical protein
MSSAKNGNLLGAGTRFVDRTGRVFRSVNVVRVLILDQIKDRAFDAS